ncbi:MULTISPECIES: VOC family protein [unclassified Pseudofrankia]|uniref:VOC family protein n=1 Tax=unclassified Pseudofrankia TaxID=2994372 RepID=UPI0008DAAB19|nr:MULTISPECIES: VOC family protein [unclassified Pseudofrankia]MDT3446712.1 VOC family protein [Pseudofrankia sp. BMG5.37]OHV57533.1 hypothetical protein BCD48_43000 [Pseudofrankia sp. BMG5.36]
MTVYDVGGVLCARPFRLGRLGHIGISVDDLALTERFYREVLGFRVTDHLYEPGGSPSPLGTFLTYNSDHHAMVLADTAAAKARGFNAPGLTLNQISFQVSTLQEVVEAHEMFVADGLSIRAIGRDIPGSNWAVYVADPDGHPVELFYGMEQIGWDGRSKPSGFRRYRATEPPKLPRPAERDEIQDVINLGLSIADGHVWNDVGEATYDVGGVLLPRPFKVINSGPIGLFVQDLDASISFYLDRLGMAVTEEGTCLGERLVHLRSGTEHHTITLMPISLRAKLGLSDRSTLATYGMQVGSYRQLRDARRFLAEQGYSVLELPPEIHAGIDFAIHVVDPEGHCVQLYYELEQVGSSGRPLSPRERRVVPDVWPEQLDPPTATSPNRTFQGPLG